MFPVGQLVKHEDGRRGVVVNRGSDGGWYTVAWLKGHDIQPVVPENKLVALQIHGHDRKEIEKVLNGRMASE